MQPATTMQLAIDDNTQQSPTADRKKPSIFCRLRSLMYSKLIALIKSNPEERKPRHCYLDGTAKAELEKNHLPQAITAPAEPLVYARLLALLCCILTIAVEKDVIFRTLGFSLECVVAGIPIIIIIFTLLSLYISRLPIYYTDTCLNIMIRAVFLSLFFMVITLVFDACHNYYLESAVKLLDDFYITRLALACVLALIVFGLAWWKIKRSIRPVELSPYNTLTGCLVMGCALNAEEDLIKHYYPGEGFEYSKRVQECKEFARHYNYQAYPALHGSGKFITTIAYLHAVAPVITGNAWLRNPYLTELTPELPESHGAIYLEIIKCKLPWDSLSSREQDKYIKKARDIDARQINNRRFNGNP